jgi:hypothetical protein
MIKNSSRDTFLRDSRCQHSYDAKEMAIVPRHMEGIVVPVDGFEWNAREVQGELRGQAPHIRSTEPALNLWMSPPPSDEDDLARWENEGGAVAGRGADAAAD